MRILLSALFVSIVAHGLFFVRARLPERTRLIRASPFVWVAPLRVTSRSRGKVATGAGTGAKTISGGESTTEWRSLGELISSGNRPPDYPPVAIEREWEGIARVRIEFDNEGRASSVSLEASSGHSILDCAALDAARSWHVEGGRRALIVPVAFELSDNG